MRYKITNPQLSKDNLKEKENWSLVPDECLTPRRTVRLTDRHNVTLTFVSRCQLNAQTCGSPIFICPLLFLKFIRSWFPSLEAQAVQMPATLSKYEMLRNS
jgi:hypothetical protein